MDEKNKKIMTPRRFRWLFLDSERIALLISGDFFVILLSINLASYFWSGYNAWLFYSGESISQILPIWFYIVPLTWFILLIAVYDIQCANNLKETFKGIGLATLIISILYLLFYFLIPKIIPRRGIAIFILSVSILTLLWRLIFIFIFSAQVFRKQVLIIGAGYTGHKLVDIFSEENLPNYSLIGLIDDDPQKTGVSIKGFPVLGDSTNLIDIINKERVTIIILAFSKTINKSLLNGILQAQKLGIILMTVPQFYSEIFSRVPIDLHDEERMINSFLEREKSGYFFLISKRVIDIVGSIIGILILAICFPLVSLVIICESGFPIFYTQKRLGKNGKIINITKFRTMIGEGEKQIVNRATEKKDPRILKVGKILRKTHLDELPQFISILINDQSLVGPRAEWIELVPNYEKNIPFYKSRLLVKPGLTGWAQIKFGYAVSVEDTSIKLGYDLFYIQNRNLLMDFYILLRTFANIIGLKGQ